MCQCCLVALTCSSNSIHMPVPSIMERQSENCCAKQALLGGPTTDAVPSLTQASVEAKDK